jgi:Ferritin-like domain
VAKQSADAGILAGLLAIERDLVLVYGTLAPERGVPAHEFRDQSTAHANGLAIALRNRGGRPPAPKARAGRATPELAIALEEHAVAVYSGAAARFGDESLLSALAAAMGNHGQHLVVLRQSLRGDPIPTAFPGTRAR